jgi:hypothetical protein
MVKALSMIPPSIAVLTVFAFLLPFLQVSCNAAPEEPFVITGMNMVTGTTLEDFESDEDPTEGEVDPQVFAILALAFMLLCAATMGTGAGRAAAQVAFGLLSLLSLIALAWKIHHELSDEGMNQFVGYKLMFGYYLAVVLSVLQVAAGAARLVIQRPADRAAEQT